MRKRGLGRGLDILLAQNKNREEAVDRNDDVVIHVELDRLQPGKYQPRRHFSDESLNELASSIKQQGLIQPIVVRAIESEKALYEILAGERRWRAAQKAGLAKVAVICRDISDKEALAVSIIENMQREDLSVIEESRGIDRLIQEFELTHAEAGEILGKSRSAISNALRMLDLADNVQKLLDEKQIDMGHARALLALTHKMQEEIAAEIVAQKLTVRETERLVKKHLSSNTDNQPKNRVGDRDPNVIALERDLSESVGALIEIRQKRGGKGEVKIKYNSLDELDGIIERIKGEDYKNSTK